MRRPDPCFLVLESYWSENLTERESVFPFVKGLCDLYAWELHYRTFDSANDLKLWINAFDHIRRSRRDKILYIASHGSQAGKLWTLEQTIPLEELIKILKPVKSVAGLHLGSCNLGRTPILQRMLSETSVGWVAAYDQEVPWLESSVLDLLFWSWMYAGAPRRRRNRCLSPEAAAHELYTHYNYSRQMGFRVIFRGATAQGISSSWDTWAEPGKSKEPGKGKQEAPA